MGIEIEEKIVCDDCELKNRVEFIKEILEDLYSELSLHCLLDGEGICGFDSERDKLIFMQGVRSGYNSAAFNLCEWGGDELLTLYEEKYEASRKIDIQVNYDPELEEKIENERLKENKADDD